MPQRKVCILHGAQNVIFKICGQMANSHKGKNLMQSFPYFFKRKVIRCTKELKTTNVYRVLAPGTRFNRRVDLLDMLSFTWSKSISFCLWVDYLVSCAVVICFSWVHGCHTKLRQTTQITHSKSNNCFNLNPVVRWHHFLMPVLLGLQLLQAHW